MRLDHETDYPFSVVLRLTMRGYLSHLEIIFAAEYLKAEANLHPGGLLKYVLHRKKYFKEIIRLKERQ
jgi:hypothetical protein